MNTTKLCIACLLTFPLLQACSNPEPAPTTATPAATAAPVTPPATATAAPIAPGDAHKACNLVTAAEMSTILGNAVVATANDDTDGITDCKYASTSGAGSSAEIMISWGDGETTLKMVREMSHHDAAGDLPYQGIGDDAVYEGPAVVVQQGKDLISVTVFGAADEPAAVKKVVDTIKSKL